MMGYQNGFQSKLFYHQINLEKRVPKDHLLRKIQEKIDFDFIYAEVRETYERSEGSHLQMAEFNLDES
jgi:hypothetical protein